MINSKNKKKIYSYRYNVKIHCDLLSIFLHAGLVFSDTSVFATSISVSVEN